MLSIQSDFFSNAVIDEAAKSIKTTRIEGMVFEFLFRDTFTSQIQQYGYEYINALVLKQYRQGGEPNHYYVLPDNPSSHRPKQLALFIEQNTKWPDMYMLDIREGRLYMTPIQGGEAVLMDSAPFQPAAPSVIDYQRAQRFLRSILPKAKTEVALALRNLIIKDCYFGKYLTDFDHFFMSEDQKPLYLETKHKYPTPDHEFGLNASELKSMSNLESMGIDVWHVILVKPYWRREIGSHVLLEDSQSRHNALWIAAPYKRLLGHTLGTGASHTSLKGSTSTTFHRIPCDEFNVLGRLDDKNELIVDRFIRLTEDDSAPRVSPDLLDELHLD